MSVLDDRESSLSSRGVDRSSLTISTTQFEFVARCLQLRNVVDNYCVRIIFFLAIKGLIVNMCDDFDLPNLPEIVSLVNEESDSEIGILNVSALDRTIQAEDFGSEFW